MTYQQPWPVSPPQQSKLSATALISFICGILGCVPLITGIFAVALGIVGFAKTSNPMVRGRWMAVTGMVLGVLSIGGWILVSVMIWGAVALTAPPRAAAHDFVKQVAAGNDAAAKAMTSGMSDEDYDALSAAMKKYGTYRDGTFFQTNVVNDEADLSGVLSFDPSATAPATPGARANLVGIEVHEKKIGGSWKITSVHADRHGP